MLLKLFRRRFSYIAIRVFIWEIEQMHFHVPHELVIFGKHHDDRNFKVMSSAQSLMFVTTHHSDQDKYPCKI